jgi:hypothetical protein
MLMLYKQRPLAVAKETCDRFVENAARLYEQEREESCNPSRLGQYIRRWFSWVSGGVGGLLVQNVEKNASGLSLDSPTCCMLVSLRWVGLEINRFH